MTTLQVDLECFGILEGRGWVRKVGLNYIEFTWVPSFCLVKLASEWVVFWEFEDVLGGNSGMTWAKLKGGLMMQWPVH